MSKLEPQWVVREAKDSRQNPPMVFVHGIYHGAWCWEEKFFGYFLSRGHSCHAVQLPSTRDLPKGVKPLEYYAKIVREYAQKLSPAPVLVGHSMAATIVSDIVQETPNWRAVLMGPPTKEGLLNGTKQTIRNHPLLYLKALLTMNIDHLYHSDAIIRRFFLSAPIDDGEYARYAAKMRNGHEALSILNTLMAYKPRPRPQVGPGVLVMGGELDRSVSRADLEQVASWHPNSTVMTIPGVSHDMMLEKNWEAAAKAIADWSSTQIFQAATIQ